MFKVLELENENVSFALEFLNKIWTSKVLKIFWALKIEKGLEFKNENVFLYFQYY